MKCADIKKSAMDIIKASNNIQWYCNACKISATEAVLSSKSIEDTCASYMENFMKIIKQVENRISSMESAKETSSDLQLEINQDYENRLAKLEAINAKLIKSDKVPCNWQKEVSDEIEKKIHEHTTATASLSMKELQDRENRKSNLIFFNIPESTEDDVNARKLHDVDEIKGLCEALGAEVEVDKPVRLGPKSEKIRPLRVHVSDPSMISDVLKAARNLPTLENEVHRKIAIRKDMTFLEREEFRELVKKRNRLMSEAKEKGLDTKWVIRNGAVTKLKTK